MLTAASSFWSKSIVPATVQTAVADGRESNTGLSPVSEPEEWVVIEGTTVTNI
jgi:hypothetical protein